MPKENSTIYAKLFEVQQALKTVEKTGYNNFNKYAYVEESEILDLLNPLLNTQRILRFVTLTSSDVQTQQIGDSLYNRAKVVIELVFVDADSPESTVSATMSGYAHDKNGDKAVYKAITGATKYAYLKFFGLSIHDDPENDSAPHSQGQSFSRPPSQPNGNGGGGPTYDDMWAAIRASGLASEDVLKLAQRQDYKGMNAQQRQEVINLVTDYKNGPTFRQTTLGVQSPSEYAHADNAIF